MRYYFILLASFILSGCTIVPRIDQNLDTTSNFTSPKKGMVGVYVYQWKRGILGAARDVDFEIKGQPKIALNTGEYGYLEVPPGQYVYKAGGGLIKSYTPVHFEPNKNYFFRAILMNMTDTIIQVRDQQEIDEAKINIKSGRYERHDID